MRVAVVGGGINGVMIAWELALNKCQVVLFERAGIMQATSAASSKMLHGGIRYLEQGRFRMVRQALQERAWWLTQTSRDLARPFALQIPVFEDSPRGRWSLGAGVKLYDWLARGSGFPRSRWVARCEVLETCPTLRSERLQGAWEYWDAQMDDQALGLWAAEQARRAGVDIRINTPVSSVSTDGRLSANGTEIRFDRVVNAAGPWASSLLEKSNIQSETDLSLVRGSHLLIDVNVPCGYVLQRNEDRRIVFVLPWRGKALLGTTEVEQDTPDAVTTSAVEKFYLMETYNRFFSRHLTEEDVIDSFAGVRPLIKSSGNVSRATRESAIERKDRLISIFGGKWTASRSLAQTVARVVLQ